jgi:hypothetical protein
MDLGVSSHEPEAQSQFSVCPWDLQEALQGKANCFVAIMGGAYEFTRNASANLREKDDSLNPALGGLLAGAVMGLKREDLCTSVWGHSG